MFDFNCLALGWCLALAFASLIAKLPMTFFVCLMGAVANAVILWG